MHEALSKVKKDLGADAIILSTRQVRGGGGTFGLFGKPMLEVTAAREAPDGEEAGPMALAALPPAAREALTARAAPRPADGSESDLMRQMLAKNRMETQSLLAPLQDDIQELRDIMQAVGDTQRNAIREDTALQQLRADMADMRQLVHALTAQSTSLKSADYPDNLVVLYQQLIFNGLEEKFARRLVEESLKSIPTKEIEDFSYVKIFLARMLMKILRTTGGIQVEPEKQKVVALVGPTGVGKTTTVAKLANRLVHEGRRVLLAAADTFRAGAAAQLAVWADRLAVPLVRGGAGADPAAVAFDALAAAVSRGSDTVLIDTAGRLHTEADLLEELKKVVRVAAKRHPAGEAPHEVLLVLDVTVGQNAVAQARAFAAALPLSGLVVTKLDGTARGGSVVALRRAVPVPVRFIGTGEALEDLEPFDAVRYARRVVGR